MRPAAAAVFTASVYQALAPTSLKVTPLLMDASPRERVISAANSARVTICDGWNAVALVPVIISLEASRSMEALAQCPVISPNVLPDFTTV
ncbi:hypothetical protein D3C86_2056210 [compost metagenome]